MPQPTYWLAGVSAVVLCTCSYDGAFSASAASGAGGAADGGAGAGTSGSDSGGQGAATASSTGGANASSSSTCVEPSVACGDLGDPCCTCTDACGANLSCIGGTCQCGNPDQPCCGGLDCFGAQVCKSGVCKPCGEYTQDCCTMGNACSPNGYLACIGGLCLHCCGWCKTDGGWKKHDVSATGGVCHEAVKNRCENINGCNGGSPPMCCNVDNCVVQKGVWGYCD
jgi:hypothetical protein